MPRYRFNVFGRILDLEPVSTGWRCYAVGQDGKRAPVQLAVPADLPASDLGQYLYDIYHELATGSQGDVTEISAPGMRDAGDADSPSRNP